MKKTWIGMLAVFLITTVLFPVETSLAQTPPKDRGVAYLVVIDTLSIEDINATDTPNLWQLVQKGSIGLSSNRTLRGQNSYDSSLTIGAGNLARAYGEGIMGYNRDEVIETRHQTASQLYQNLTGWDPADSACLLVNLPEILAGISRENVSTMPGALGEVLRSNHRLVCVLGNSDINSIVSRSSIAIGMDAAGRVPLGDIGAKNYKRSSAGYLGWETNYPYLLEKIKRYRSRADLIIVELGDLARMERADVAFPAIIEQQKEIYLYQLDQFVGQLSAQIDPQKDLMVVISPSPSLGQIINKNTFTPVIAYGKDINQGYLTSGATRRPYILANTDIAPTILNFFEIKPISAMIGQAVSSKTATGIDTLKEAQMIGQSAARVNRLRAPLVKGYIVMLLIIILLSMFVIFVIPRLISIVEPLVASLVSVPLVLLFLGKINLGSDSAYIIFAVTAVIGFTALVILACRFDFFKTFVVIAALTVAALDFDLITGAAMIQKSVLGYDAMAGARYYGIGNEYMGILLGSVIILGAVAYERFPKKWALALISLVFLGHCYIIAGPSLGAQSDGVITAPAAFLVTIVLLSNIKINSRTLLGILGIVLAAVFGLTIYDMNRPPEIQTHIGRAANQIVAGGWKEGLTIVARKMGMNAKLIRYTIWSRVFLVMLAVLALLVYRPVGAMGKIREQRPRIAKGFAGIITAAIVGLVINDSGIVAAATTSIYMVVPLLLLIMDLQKKATPEGLE